MSGEHRGLWLAVVVFMMATSGCDGSEGAWVNTPPDPNPRTPILELYAPHSTAQNIASWFTPIDTTEHPNRQYWLRCDIAVADPINTDISGPTVPYYQQQDRVCLGEPTNLPPPTLCRQVQTYEARIASITTCYAKMRYLIAARSKEILGDRWAATVLPLLPSIWSTSPEQTNLFNTRISVGVIDLMTGGIGAESAPGSPLCFPLDGLQPQLAALVAVKKIQTLVQGTTQNVNNISSALLRGVSVQVTEDLKLQLAAQFVEAPTPNIESADCNFAVAPVRP